MFVLSPSLNDCEYLVAAQVGQGQCLEEVIERRTLLCRRVDPRRRGGHEHEWWLIRKDLPQALVIPLRAELLFQQDGQVLQDDEDRTATIPRQTPNRVDGQLLYLALVCLFAER